MMFSEDSSPVRGGCFVHTRIKRPTLALLFIAALVTLCFGETEEYVLQPGDVISISVVEHPEFSGRHKIRPDGRINYPVIGELDVATLTCAQLVKIMQGKLSSYVNNPVVSVSIEEYYSNKIYIIGAVRQPGQYQIYEPIDILKAVAMCGGLQNLRIKTIRIIRADGSIVTVETKTLWGGEGKRDTKKYVLYPGDTMYVPESFEIPWALITTVLTVIILSMEIVIYSQYMAK
ncbi:MAG TPA: polysaccharide biosynthesis/export family protein [Chitinivibrionales bacterium]|nr:polysaccharide biosynthesis/export family protein [Chitinivibrionales bacterium]